jgi:hypothetical protein
MHRVRAAALAAFLCLAFVPRAQASFHIMRISEVMTQAGGDARIQFVELTMAIAGQDLVKDHDLFFYDAHGNLIGSFRFPANVMNGANKATILVGTQAFADIASAPPDFILPAGLLSPFAGRVTWEGEGDPLIDAVAYGAFDGANTGFGAPAPGFPVLGAQSLTLLTVTAPGPPRDNAAEYAFAAPTPRKNNGTDVVLTIPPRVCYVTDDFADMSRWDRPAPNAGLDLTGCRGPSGADIGVVNAVGNKLVFTPGETVLSEDFGAPIALTGLKRSAAAAIADPSYRARFDMLARAGISDGACFVRQRYAFDDPTSLLDVSESAGFGINFGFDDIGEVTDHIHADARVSCLQSGIVDSEDQTNLGDFKMQTGTPYTVILDVDGDDAHGPLNLNVKLYPADRAEPPYYLAQYTVAQGFGPPSDESLNHAFLFAALGSSDAAIELSGFSICAIPRNQKHVRQLTCLRNEDGTVSVAWANPFDAPDESIAIRVNGAEAGTVPGTETTFTIDDPPAGPLVIAVVNYSGTPVECSVCENHPPVPVIDGPAQVPSPDGVALVTLDSTASTDGDDGTQGLVRLWEIVSAPPEGAASLDDAGAVIVHISVNAAGTYVMRLTLVDGGCENAVGLTEVRQHTFVVEIGAADKQKPGDFNQDGELNLSDPIATLNHLFVGGASALPPCGDQSVNDPANKTLLDANGDASINLSDPIFVLNFLFSGGPLPANCSDMTCPCLLIPGCPPLGGACP